MSNNEEFLNSETEIFSSDDNCIMIDSSQTLNNISSWSTLSYIQSSDFKLNVNGKEYSVSDMIKKVEKTEKVIEMIIDCLPEDKRDSIKLFLELDEENKDANND